METPLSPLEFAKRSHKLYPEKLAVVDGDLHLTYREFFSRCNKWSKALQKFGVKKGDKVAYIAPNTHAQLESFYSVPQIGAIVVPINYRLASDEINYIVNHSDAMILCVHSDYIDLVNSIRHELPNVQQFVSLDSTHENWVDYEQSLSENGEDFIQTDIDELDLISINYTSGTTARPKGVMITHRNAYMNAVGTMIHCHLSSDEKYLWTLPMFHANGWTFVWIITAVGGTHVCLPKVDPQNIFTSIQKNQVTFFCAAPTVLISICNADAELQKLAPRGIRLLTAGAPPAAATIERIEQELGWKLTQVYGLTETAPFITICEERASHKDLTAAELATVKARQGVELITSGEIKVLDLDKKEVPRDGKTLGEIVAKGNVVMKGYYKDPEATAKAIQDGWFYSGDVAVVNPDGFVEIRDRSKDVIISGGENISSVEIEAVLLKHPAVQEVAVVGMPHEKWGESPHAFVVLKPGKTSTEAEIKAFVTQHLASFKKPSWVSFIEDLPKTATGKIQKFVLRGNKSAISKQ